jgi:PPOX class probable F420-dependent enzyme
LPAKLPEDLEARLVEFLRPPRIAVVATIGKTGAPQLSPNWYRYADGTLSVSTTKQRLKYVNLSRDDRLVVCIYSGTLARQYVTLRGRAQIIEDESIWPETRAIVERYDAPERVETRMRRLRTQDRVIIALKPDRVHFTQPHTLEVEGRGRGNSNGPAE